MRKSILFVAVAVFAMVFSGCKEEAVEITFSSNDIILPLGSSSNDLAKFATASDGSTVTVSGVDFGMIGEQTATFAVGDVKETKIVKISATPLAGEYRIHILDSAATTELTNGNGWIMTLTPGAEYNQIDIPSTVGQNKIFTDVDKLTVTFNGSSVKIPNYTGKFAFIQSQDDFTIKFQNITYGTKDDGTYALKGFTLKITREGYNDFYEQVRFDKLSEWDEEE